MLGLQGFDYLESFTYPLSHSQTIIVIRPPNSGKRQRTVLSEDIPTKTAIFSRSVKKVPSTRGVAISHHYKVDFFSIFSNFETIYHRRSI